MATESQIARLRELARDYGLPAEAVDYVEEQIAGGLTDEAAYELILQLGGRIADWKAALPIKKGRPGDRTTDEPELPLIEEGR